MEIGWNELGFKEAFGFVGGDIRLKGLSPYLLTRVPGSSASSLAICLVL